MMPLLGNVAIIQKKFLRVTKINLGDTSNEREGVHLHTLEDHDVEALQERG